MASGNRDNAGTVLGGLLYWLGKWDQSIGLRWKRLCDRMRSEGISPPDALLVLTRSGVRVKIGLNNRPNGALLVEVVEGNPHSLREYATGERVSVAVLREIQKQVREALEVEEKRIDELIEAVPKLVDEFRCDVAEEHLEQQAKGVGLCLCGHPIGDHSRNIGDGLMRCVGTLNGGTTGCPCTVWRQP